MLKNSSQIKIKSLKDQLKQIRIKIKKYKRIRIKAEQELAEIKRDEIVK
jgi:hypothetical protein